MFCSNYGLESMGEKSSAIKEVSVRETALVNGGREVKEGKEGFGESYQSYSNCGSNEPKPGG